jgi:hypothetical protein
MSRFSFKLAVRGFIATTTLAVAGFAGFGLIASAAGAAGVIMQTGIESDSTTPAGESSIADQLTESGDDGSAVSWTQTSGSGLQISSSGVVTTTGLLGVGTYSIGGTVSDADGDTGSFAYTLNVTTGTITQTGSTSDNATPGTSSTYSTQLGETGDDGSAVTWTQTNNDANLSISSSGLVSTTGTLAVGDYVISGTVDDADGDTGTFSFTLSVADGGITQTGSTSDNATPGTSSTYSTQLSETGDDGSAVTWTQTNNDTNLSISSSGLVSTTGTLAVGDYVISGTVDDADGDTGTFTFTLDVTAGTITQTGATSGPVTPAGSVGHTTQLSETGDDGSAVTWTQTNVDANLSISNSGLVSVVGTVPVGSYVISGTITDADGDTGSFTYTLGVISGSTSQIGATSGSVLTTNSFPFSAQLAESGSLGTVTWTQTNVDASLSITSGGLVSTTGILGAGSYVISGTTLDTYGDTGTFSYTLTVTAPSSGGGGGGGGGTPPAGGVITQSSPTSGTSPVSGSVQLNVTGATGPVAFTTTNSTNSGGISVSASGLVSIPAGLTGGIYSISGTDKDASGDTGTWSYSYTVASGPKLTGVSASIKGTTATVSWSASGTNADAAYVVTPLNITTGKVGASIRIIGASRTSVPRLVGGDTYTFTVALSGATGAGSSVVSAKVRAPAKPTVGAVGTTSVKIIGHSALAQVSVKGSNLQGASVRGVTSGVTVRVLSDSKGELVLLVSVNLSVVHGRTAAVRITTKSGTVERNIIF